MDWKAVRAELAEQGWSVANGKPDAVARSAATAGLELVASQNHGPVLSRLRPYRQDQAPAKSLSAVYGLGAQPLHTDGAHLRTPPDIIALHSAVTSPTSTVIWHFPRNHEEVPEEIGNGMFTVRGSSGSFLAPAFDGCRLRFDPVCMSPGDGDARRAVVYFAESRERAYVHDWNEEDTILFIDNRGALHARNALGADVGTRLVSRLTFIDKAAP